MEPSGVGHNSDPPADTSERSEESLEFQSSRRARPRCGLPPSSDCPGHGQNELTKIFGNSRSADGSGFPPPEHFKAFAMPSRKGLGSNRNQSSFPIKQSCRQYHGEPSGIGGPSGSNLTSLVEGQLFAQDEILSSQGGPWEAAQESDEVQTDAVKGQRGMPKASCRMRPVNTGA